MSIRPGAAFSRKETSAPKMPHLDALQPLYDMNVYPRRGELIMIVGRSGSFKSTVALFLAESWGLPTLYFSADMSASQATLKLAALRTQATISDVEQALAEGNAGDFEDALEGSKVEFSFRSPISFDDIIGELNSWVTLHNAYPEVIVVDNLQDIDGGESDYTEQMYNMSALSDLARQTGSTILLLHHATESGAFSAGDYVRPPSRNSIKNKVTEKPELILGVAANGDLGDLYLAPLKNRLGFADPTGHTFARLRVVPEKNLIHSPSASDYLRPEVVNGH